MGSGLDASLSLQLGPAPLPAALPGPQEAAVTGDQSGPITCVHCQQAVSPAELRLAIQCGRPACSRYAHALCAVEQGYAGVLEAPALDGQYLCRLCGTKSDLLPYWKERLAAAATGEGLALGQHLGLAARLLHKTRRAEVEPVQAQVEYAVAQLVAGQDADIIAKLLRQLAAEADRVAPGLPTDAAGSAAVSAASPPWPRTDFGSATVPPSGSGGKVERNFLVCLRTASAGLDRARPAEAPLLGGQAALTLGRPEAAPTWGHARTASDGPAAGEHPQGSDAQLVAAERLAHLTRTLQAAVEDAQAEALRLKAQAEADLRRAHAAREDASAAEGAARRALDEAAAQEGVARASIAAAQRAADKVQQLSARGEAQLEALKEELATARGLCAAPEPTALPFTQPSKGAGTAGGAGPLYGENLESSLRSQLKMAKLLDSLRAADRHRAEERRRADQLRFKKAPSLPAGADEGLIKGDDAAERKGGLLAALRADPAGGANGERAAADTFLMLSSGGGSTALKRGRPSEGPDSEAGGLLGFAAKVSRSSPGMARTGGEEGADGKEAERGAAVLAQARDFLTEMHREGLPPGAGRSADGGGEAALAAERSIKDAELVMRAELAVLQNLVPTLARQFGERKFRVLVIAALARQWDGTWRLCLTRRKGKGFRLQLPMCGLDAGLDLLREERPDTLPLARKLARDCLGETPDTVLLSSPAGYDTPVIYKEEQKDGSLTMALIHPLLASPAAAPTAHAGTSYHHGDTFVSWCRADALVPVVRDVPQKFSATFPRVLKCLELLMSNPLDGWPLPALLKLGVQAPDVLG